MDEPLDKYLDGTVLRLTLNMPQRRNALSTEMLNHLNDALDDAGQDSSIALIVLGATGNVFCPGHDLKEMTAAREHADGGRAFFDETMTLCSTVMQKIFTHRVPIIADVRGVATAAGCQLVASCDLAVASDTATFATPGVHIGLFCSTPMVALSRNIVRKHAMEMLLTGCPVSAQEALGYGLINRAVPADQVDEEIAKFADAITSKSTLTLKIGKKAFYQQLDMTLSEAYDHCAQVMVENMMTHDAEEGINAFVEKRSPKWKNT